MNTCLSNLYLKLSKFDTRYIRVALIVLSLFAFGGHVMGLPINGDLTG